MKKQNERINDSDSTLCRTPAGAELDDNECKGSKIL